VLVVGMRLGCINHALLTCEAIARDGLRLAGWVANRSQPDMSCYAENVQALRAMVPAQCLGEVPHLATRDPREAAVHLNCDPLVL
jgi:dethiobiotin synthetase